MQQPDEALTLAQMRFSFRGNLVAILEWHFLVQSLDDRHYLINNLEDSHHNLRFRFPILYRI